MEKLGITKPVILKKQYNEDEITVNAGIDFGPLFLDGFGDGLWIDSVEKHNKDQRVELSFQLLQAAGARISQTEFIACPSCGRTLYNIEAALAEIKQHTAHLKGLKIAVMGCIVNGPGEMADADYGYVGMGAGKVALFKGKNLVKKNVPQSEAVGELISLIKANGDWQEYQLISE
jgi:(E)-4-hydroxy-3-methylbut-2-enyl-diphosphate synthase